MSARQYGILGTIILHNIILLILLFSFLSLPKTAPPEAGLVINFGDVESAGGKTEPAVNTETVSSPPAQAEKTSSSEEGIMTQNYEKAPAIKTVEPKKKTEKKTKTEQPVTKPEVKKSKPVEKPVINQHALYSNRGQSTSESSSNQGLYKGPGNMGNPSGTPESDNYAQGLSSGSGIAFNLNGRNPVHLQKPEFNIMKEGIVVVEIVVDRSGKVISAKPGQKGSTLVDNTLWSAARKAAMESKFNIKEDAPEQQVGTITYHFKLQ